MLQHKLEEKVVSRWSYVRFGNTTSSDIIWGSVGGAKMFKFEEENDIGVLS